MLNELTRSKWLKNKSIQVGRWNGSWRWNSSTRGLNGQKSRSGARIRRWFQWGQTPLSQQLPKLRWFKRYYKLVEKVSTVNLDKLSVDHRVNDGDTINKDLLLRLNYINNSNSVKVLSNWESDKKFNFEWIEKFSKSAKELIEKNGGTIN